MDVIQQARLGTFAASSAGMICREDHLVLLPKDQTEIVADTLLCVVAIVVGRACETPETCETVNTTLATRTRPDL
jgi:hypothetical protein